jgi:hypothetical protein
MSLSIMMSPIPDENIDRGFAGLTLALRVDKYRSWLSMAINGDKDARLISNQDKVAVLFHHFDHVVSAIAAHDILTGMDRDTAGREAKAFIKVAMSNMNKDIKLSLPLVALVETSPELAADGLINGSPKISKEGFDDILIALVKKGCQSEVNRLIVDDRFDVSDLTYLSDDNALMKACVDEMGTVGMSHEIARIEKRLGDKYGTYVEHESAFAESHRRILEPLGALTTQYLFARTVELSEYDKPKRGYVPAKKTMDDGRGKYSTSLFCLHESALLLEVKRLRDPSINKELLAYVRAKHLGLDVLDADKKRWALPEIGKKTRAPVKRVNTFADNHEWEDFAQPSSKRPKF